MELRASFGGASVSRTFVAAVLVIVAMGLAAMSGYLAKGLTSGSAATSPAQAAHAAPGSVLRQDNPVQPSVELPWYIQSEINAQPTPRIRQDDSYFISLYAPSSPAAPQGRSTGHKELD